MCSAEIVQNKGSCIHRSLGSGVSKAMPLGSVQQLVDAGA